MSLYELKTGFAVIDSSFTFFQLILMLCGTVCGSGYKLGIHSLVNIGR